MCSLMQLDFPKKLSATLIGMCSTRAPAMETQENSVVAKRDLSENTAVDGVCGKDIQLEPVYERDCMATTEDNTSNRDRYLAEARSLYCRAVPRPGSLGAKSGVSYA